MRCIRLASQNKARGTGNPQLCSWPRWGRRHGLHFGACQRCWCKAYKVHSGFGFHYKSHWEGPSHLLYLMCVCKGFKCHMHCLSNLVNQPICLYSALIQTNTFCVQLVRLVWFCVDCRVCASADCAVYKYKKFAHGVCAQAVGAETVCECVRVCCS